MSKAGAFCVWIASIWVFRDVNDVVFYQGNALQHSYVPCLAQQSRHAVK